MSDRQLVTKTKLACEIARLDRQRFNEAVAAGNYRCAPPTTRGAARIFDVDDIIAMFLYGRLVEWEIPPRRAGSIACQLRERLDQEAPPQRLHFFKAIAGMSVVFENVGSAEEVTTIVNGKPVGFSVCIYVDHIREHVLKNLKEAPIMVGGDE